MKTTLKTALLATTLSVAGFAAAPALAQDDAAGPTIEGNVAFTSDYRFRGVSLSDTDAAVQGGFDLGFEPGFYIGTWGSSIEPYGGSEMELDLYGGYGFEAAGLAFDVGALWYYYPGGTDVDYYELYGSVGTDLGPVAATLGVAYAPEQDNLGSVDNTYVYVAGDLPLGDSPFALSASVGWEDGVFAEKVDWSLGVSTSVLGVDLSLAYVDAEDDVDTDYDGGAVFTISKAL